MPCEPVNLTRDQPGVFNAFPSVASAADGSIWIAWVGFEDRQDRIFARQVVREGAGHVLLPTETVSTQPGANFWPQLVICDTCPQVVWAHHAGEGWEVHTRARHEDGWGDERVLSRDMSAWQPAACLDERGVLWVCWVSVEGGDIWLCREDGEPELASDTGRCSRPQIAATERGLLVVWDCYEDGVYNIRRRLRRSGGEWADFPAVSRGPEWELAPQLGVAGDGTPFCVWVAIQDVRDGRGVIDQKHFARCARLVGNAWRPAADDDLGTLAELFHGLLAKEQVWGYLGRRRHPFLRTDGDGRMWALWERKTDPDASMTPGVLVGRQYSGDGWEPPVEITAGLCYYELEERRPDKSGPLWATMRPPKGKPAWDIHLAPVSFPDPNAPMVSSGDWSEWQPIKLPEDIAPRPVVAPVEDADATCNLFFGDLHCHTTLSADAEGEVDELYHYARDKARLDFVALVDNDCYECPMTASEFEVARASADLFDEPGRFVALCGYEWTRWDKEREKHPNHRTVLFPHDSDIFRHTDAETPDNEDLAREVSRLGGILLTQHWDWTLTDSDAEAGLEVCAAWAYYIDKPEPFHRDLVAGRRLAFIGGSDSHRRNPGTCGALTGLYARELTREGIFEAIRARRAYATSGSPMALEFRVNGRLMGAEIVSPEPPRLSVRVHGTRPLEKVIIVRGVVGGDIGDVGPVHEVAVQGMSAQVQWIDEGRPEGTVFYYVIAKQQGQDIHYPSNLVAAEGCRAWSSPIWVQNA